MMCKWLWVLICSCMLWWCLADRTVCHSVYVRHFSAVDWRMIYVQCLAVLLSNIKHLLTQILFYSPSVRYGTVWYVMVRYGTLCFFMVRYVTIWYDMVRYGTIWCDIIQYDNIWYVYVTWAQNWQLADLNSITLTHTHSHTLSHTLTISHTHSHTYTHSHTHTHTHARTRTHTHTHTLSHTHTRPLTHIHSHTHTHTHSHTHTLTHTVTRSVLSQSKLRDQPIGRYRSCYVQQLPRILNRRLFATTLRIFKNTYFNSRNQVSIL